MKSHQSAKMKKNAHNTNNMANIVIAIYECKIRIIFEAVHTLHIL